MLRLPRRLRRPLHLALLTLPLLLMLAWVIWTEVRTLDQTRAQIRQDAQSAASNFAAVVSRRLHTQFTELQFAAVALLGPDADPRQPDPKVVQTLRRFMALHPSLYAFNIQSPDGNTILWSTQGQRDQPITSGAAFTPLPDQPDFLLGQDRYAKRVGTHVLTMRFRAPGPDGTVRYMVGTPYRLDQLLKSPTAQAAGLPWRFTVRDTRDGSVLGVVEHGRVEFAQGMSAPRATSVTVPISGYPLAVQASWPADLAWQTDMRGALWRWGGELGSLLLLGLALGWIVRLLQQRDRQVQLLQRMGQLQDFLAQVNQEAALMTQEDAFLQKVCDLAITRGKLALAFVGRPNAQGLLHYPATAGRTDYLDGLLLSTDPSIPEGQGPAGRVWREGKPLFDARFEGDLLAPWRERAHALGLQASATFLLRRQGEPFALLALYRGDDVAFNPEMQALLSELAEDVCRGLDRIAERSQLHLLLEAAQSFPDGVTIADTQNALVFVNRGFATITGYEPEEALGRNCNFLQGPSTDPAIVQRLRDALQNHESVHVELQNVRKDGTVFWNALLIAPVRDASGEVTHFLGLQRDITAERETQDLRDALLQNSASGIAVARRRQLVQANTTMAALLGCNVTDLVGHATRVLYADDAEFERVGAAYDALATEGQVALSNVRLQRVGGQVVLCDLHLRLLPDGVTVVATFVDVTTREHQAQALLRMQRLYSALMFEGDVLLQARDSRSMLDHTCASLTQDTHFHAAWIAQPNEAGRMQVLAQAGEGTGSLDKFNILLSASEHAPLVAQAWKTEQVVFNNDYLADPHMAAWTDFLREHRWAAALAAPVRRGAHLWAILVFVSPEAGVFDDDTVTLCTRVADLLGHGLDELDLKERLLQLQRQEALAARTDALTGLPNRFALEQHLPHALERARRHGSAVAVGMIDLDDFKPVNDQFGHDAGDALLRQIAQQLQAQLRGNDYLARLGGDEFVLVLEDLDPAHVEPQLAIILQRLDRVIQAPFDLGQARQARVGMTLGLALFPEDGEDTDTLLRNADAAMYQAKARKSDRTQWWRLWREGTLAAPQVEAPFEAFGEGARRVLQALTPILQAIAPEFAKAFYAELAHEPQTAAILQSLSPDEFAHLQDMQAQHLQFLLHPDTTAQSIEARAQHLGQVHALVGLPIASQLQAFDLYISLVRAQIESTPLMAQTRYQVLRIIQVRLQYDLQGEIAAQQALLSSYQSVLTRALPRQGRWSDLVVSELDGLATLPGLRGAFVLRVDDAGKLRIVAHAGDVAAEVQAEIETRGLHPTIHPGPDGRRGPMGQAWISGEKQVVDAYLLDHRLQPWHPMMQRLGVRSAMALPLRRGEVVDALLFLLGAYPHQFSGHSLRAWFDVVQYRFEQLLIASTEDFLPPPDALHMAQWRDLLYRGALHMVVQPVVDLRSGVVTKIEALARLQADDGTRISPGLFLPGLGQNDLQVLFRQALTQSLRFLRAWRQAGMDITLSLNLAPTTLVAPDCALWVERALREADLPPAALTLELLETQDVNGQAIDEAIARVRALGVGLAMDDLGSGYSSMKRLVSLPFDVIKIDQDVVQDVKRHPLQRIALMRTVLQLGRDMGCAVVAEGLEDAALIEVALMLGCPLGQGYGLVRPMPIEAFPEWLSSHSPLPLPSGAELHSWLGATAYLWISKHDDHLQRHRTSLATCPLTRFLQRQGVQDAVVLRWHALWHESAFEKERMEAGSALLQWMEQEALARSASSVGITQV